MNNHCLKFGFKNMLETLDRSFFDRSYFEKNICLSYSCTPFDGPILNTKVFVGADHLHK